MANVDCKNCGTAMSTQAALCPKCGHPNKSKHLPLSEVLGGLAVGIGVIWYLASGSYSTPSSLSSLASATSATQTKDSRPPVAVSALQLYLDYQANEVSADNLYKGRRLAVSDALTGISKDFTNEIYLTLRTPDEFMNVRADLQPSEVQKASQLKKGSLITVACEGNGMIVGTPMLKDCVVR